MLGTDRVPRPDLRFFFPNKKRESHFVQRTDAERFRVTAAVFEACENMKNISP